MSTSLDRNEMHRDCNGTTGIALSLRGQSRGERYSNRSGAADLSRAHRQFSHSFDQYRNRASVTKSREGNTSVSYRRQSSVSQFSSRKL